MQCALPDCCCRVCCAWCRSLGDFAFKSPQALISAEPFVNTHTLDPTDRLVLLTSDGVTDVLPDDDMLDIGLHAIEQVQDQAIRGAVCRLGNKTHPHVLEQV